MKICRRHFVLSLSGGCAMVFAQSPVTTQQNDTDPQQPLDWTCPMDRDVHMDSPGKCPRCGMTLVLKVPDRIEHRLDVTIEPAVLKPGCEASISLRVHTPNGEPVTAFETVHEKLIHLFLVSENLDFFEHIHPQLQADGTFRVTTRLGPSGMYRLLADYYPAASTPELSLSTFYVPGPSSRSELKPSVAPQSGANLSASLQLDSPAVIAGQLSRLMLDVNPAEGLERYLGAWAHMLIASEDLVDLIHTHPFLTRGSTIQFNVIFPRAGLYRIWIQMQRLGVVNTVVFTLPVQDI